MPTKHLFSIRFCFDHLNHFSPFIFIYIHLAFWVWNRTFFMSASFPHLHHLLNFKFSYHSDRDIVLVELFYKIEFNKDWFLNYQFKTTGTIILQYMILCIYSISGIPVKRIIFLQVYYTFSKSLLRCVYRRWFHIRAISICCKWRS